MLCSWNLLTQRVRIKGRRLEIITTWSKGLRQVANSFEFLYVYIFVRVVASGVLVEDYYLQSFQVFS